MLTALLVLMPAQADASVRELIDGLRSAKVEVREAASKKLVALGEAAVDGLKRARKDKDAEVAGRAKAILKEIEVAARERRENEAGELFERSKEAFRKAGKAADEKGKRVHLEEALGFVRKIAREYKDTKLRGMAQHNAGVLLCNYLADFKAAIGEFEALIASDVDDKDPTGRLMIPFRNYRYNAWRMISICREELKKPALAVDACFRMKTAYVSHCGTCVAGMEREFAKRVVSICGVFEGVEGETVKKRVEKAEAADELLIDLARDALGRKERAAAKAILGAIVRDLPKSKGALIGAKLLEGIERE